MSERVLKTFVTKWLLLLSLLCSTQAQALDVQLFRPNFDQQGGIVVQNSHTMQKRSFAPGVFINWVRNPIEFGLTNDSRTDTLVGWFATVDLLFAYGVTDDLTVGLDMPFNLSSNIEPIGTIFQGASSSIGDLNLFAKYRLLKHQEDRKIIPGIAIILFVALPTGDDGVFFGNDKVSGGFKLAMNWRLSDKQDLSFNVGPRFRETDTVLNLSVGNELLGSIGYNHLIWEKHKLNLAVELFGSTTFKNFMSEEITSPLEILVGLRKPWMNERLQTTFGIGRGGTNGYGSPDARIFAGATYFFSGPKQKPDTDSDGIKDHRDTCPNEAEDVDQYQDQDGCPDPDNDKGDPYEMIVDKAYMSITEGASADQEWYTGKKCLEESEMLHNFRAYTMLCMIDGSHAGSTDCTETDNDRSYQFDGFYTNNDIIYTSWWQIQNLP